MSYTPDALRQMVVERAKGCCEYCLIPQASKLYSFEVDHIIAEKHRGKTEAQNLCLSCLECNRSKGSDFASFDPESDTIAFLFNPRRDRWLDHFRLDDAWIEPLTAQGRVTVFLLHLNSDMRLSERGALIDAGHYPPFALDFVNSE